MEKGKKDKGNYEMLIMGILAFLLGGYVLLNASDWIFTAIFLLIGFVIFVIGIAFLFFAILGIFNSIPTKKHIAKWNRDQKKNERYELKEIDKIKRRHKNYENKLTELSTKYGDITANITYYFESRWQFIYDNLVNRQKEILSKEYILSEDYFGDSFRKIEKSFIVFENSSTLFIENNPYHFKDIINFNVCDNSEMIYSGSASSSTKTKTGSMIGRAVVGGVLLGGAGAVIGGATAKKDSNTSISQSSHTIHNYEIIITINSLSMPSLKLEIGYNQDAMQKISSILSIIIERN